MKGKIFLSGGGDLEDAEKIDSAFFDCLESESKILYIPIALDRDVAGFEVCHDWFSNIISHRAGDKNINFSMILMSDKIPSLDNYDAIYIGGGNTFKLLDYIIKNDLGLKIIKYLNQGGLVYGGSAGAIIFGRDIRTVSEENDKNYKNYKGLNLVNDISLICHYDESLDSKIFDSLITIDGNIIALQENAGLIITDNKIDVISDPIFFSENNKQKFEGKKQQRT